MEEKKYTCPECGIVVDESSLAKSGSCPKCGCPAKEFYAAAATAAAKEIRDRQEKESRIRAALPKTPDARYKTPAARVMLIFAWVVWILGGIGSILLSIRTQSESIYYPVERTHLDATTFVISASACLVCGALFFAASKLLLDLHAVRVNLEQLNSKNREGN